MQQPYEETATPNSELLQTCGGASGGATDAAGPGVVDEVDRAVGIAPEVDAREGLLDRPSAERLDPVVWNVVIGP